MYLHIISTHYLPTFYPLNISHQDWLSSGTKRTVVTKKKILKIKLTPQCVGCCTCRKVWRSRPGLLGELHCHRGGESLQWLHWTQLWRLHQPLHQPDRQEWQRRTEAEVPPKSKELSVYQTLFSLSLFLSLTPSHIFFFCSIKNVRG